PFRGDAIRVITFYDFTESLPDPLFALVAWNSQHQVIIHPQHRPHPKAWILNNQSRIPKRTDSVPVCQYSILLFQAAAFSTCTVICRGFAFSAFGSSKVSTP